MARWLLTTVPHSGTRFFFRAVKAGTRGTQIHTYYSRSAYASVSGPLFLWGHFEYKLKDTLWKVAEEAEYRIVTLRSPEMILGTHYLQLDCKCPRTRIQRTEQKKTALRHYWILQEEYIKTFDPIVFPIERLDFEDAGIKIEATLREPRTRYGHEYPLKEALKARDEHRIEEIIEDVELWSWFKQYATPTFEKIYREYGYDLWWIDG